MVTDRPRYALLVRLLSREQREAIVEACAERFRAGDTRSVTAILRSALLGWAGRADLDRDIEPQAERARLGGIAKRESRS